MVQKSVIVLGWGMRFIPAWVDRQGCKPLLSVVSLRSRNGFIRLTALISLFHLNGGGCYAENSNFLTRREFFNR
jgi:hypothetical protein